MTLLPLLFASAGAPAGSDVSQKPHVGGIDLVADSVIEVSALAGAEEHQGKRRLPTTGTSDVPFAARGAGKATDVLAQVRETGTALKGIPRG